MTLAIFFFFCQPFIAFHAIFIFMPSIFIAFLSYFISPLFRFRIDINIFIIFYLPFHAIAISLLRRFLCAIISLSHYYADCQPPLIYAG